MQESDRDLEPRQGEPCQTNRDYCGPLRPYWGGQAHLGAHLEHWKASFFELEVCRVAPPQVLLGGSDP